MGRLVNLAFIVNVVKNCSGDICGVFAGDCVQAHRAGVAMAEESFKILVGEGADIVIVSSHPADLDYWQAIKGVTAAYFAVKKGEIIVFVAPCREGLATNHPRFREWLSLPLDEVLSRLKASSPYDVEADMVSAVLSVCNCRVT